MGSMSWWHWVIVLIVVVILFGSKKLPEAARGLGRSLRIFKSEMQEMQNENNSSNDGEEPKKRELTASPSESVDTTRNSAEDKKSA